MILFILSKVNGLSVKICRDVSKILSNTFLKSVKIGESVVKKKLANFCQNPPLSLSTNALSLFFFHHFLFKNYCKFTTLNQILFFYLCQNFGFIFKLVCVTF